MSVVKPCPHPGCAATSSHGGLCPAHRKQRQQTTDARRETATERGYDARWRKARRWFLWRNPFCATCKREGTLTPAAVVDHIVAHKGDAALFWNSETNWQSLCKAHHDEKTSREDGGFGNRRTGLPAAAAGRGRSKI